VQLLFWGYSLQINLLPVFVQNVILPSVILLGVVMLMSVVVQNVVAPFCFSFESGLKLQTGTINLFCVAVIESSPKIS